MDSAAEKDLNIRGFAFRFEHVRDVLRGEIAEKLAQSFLVIRDVMFLDEGDEVGGCVSGQGGFGEVFVCGDKAFRLAMKIGEVAAAPAGDQDFLADFIGPLEHGDATSAFTGFDGAKQSGGAGADNQSVKFMNQ